MKRFVALLIACFSTEAALAQPELDNSALAQLHGLRPDESASIANLPIGLDRQAAVRMRRIDVYAPDAHVWIAGERGLMPAPRSDWRHYIADQDVPGAPLLALSIAPDGRQARGMLLTAEGEYDIQGEPGEDGLELRVRDADDLAPKGVQLRTQCGGAPKRGMDPLGFPLSVTPEILESPAAPAGVTRQAIIAVDTDNEFMSLKFSNNSTNATNYIAALFTQMNVIYERDLDMRLVQGLVILRPSTTTDPFVQGPSGNAANQAQLVEFGSWWQTNQSATNRVLAMMLSGKSPDANVSSGIAWLVDTGSYCTQRDGNFGTYSFSQVFRFAGANATHDTQVVAHELGHNFGAAHTHCTDTNPGMSGLQPIDQCFNGEAGLGCFGGAPSCPGGPGTLMSYCHFGPPSGASCGVNLIFAGFHITQLNGRIAANFPSCITALGAGDTIFANGYE